MGMTQAGVRVIWYCQGFEGAFGYGVSLLPSLPHPYFGNWGPKSRNHHPLERIQIHCSGYFIVKLGDFHRRMRT